MYLLKMFLDEFLVIMRFPGRGFLFRDGCLHLDEYKHGRDMDEEPDVESTKLVVEIANSLEVESDIKMTFDTISLNASHRMPVLDLQVRCREDKLLFMFYEKSLVSPYEIHSDDPVLSWNVKKESLAGEVCRRHLNTSPCLVEEGVVGKIIVSFDTSCYPLIIHIQSERLLCLRVYQGTQTL